MKRFPTSLGGRGPLLCPALLSLALAGCGGGGGSSSTPAPTPTGPTLTSISPGYASMGATDQTVEAVGTGFTTASTLDWNGTVLVTSYVSATLLKATIPAADLVVAGQYPVTAVDAGIASSPVEYRVDGPLTATSLSPATANVGSGATLVTVDGTGFVPDSVVEWNGVPLTTTFVSVTQLRATVPAADLATLGTGGIFVTNPTEAKSTTSFSPLDFTVGYSMTVLQQGINDMVWDASTQLIYASAGTNAQTNANTLMLIDPAKGKIKSTLTGLSNPDTLAISDDSSLLYVGMDGSSSVQRFVLPAFTADISIPLGSTCNIGACYALAIAVAPGAAHTIAVSRGSLGLSPATQGPVSIFDDGTERGTTIPQPPNYVFNLQWGNTDNILYSGNGDITSYEFYNMAVSVGGVTITSDPWNVFNSGFASIHYDSTTNLVYADNGQVVDPNTSTVVGTFSLPVQNASVMIPDSASGKAYFAYTELNSATHSFDVVIQSFDINTHASIAEITLPGAGSEGPVTKILRWGTNGLAIRQSPGGNTFGFLYLISSSMFVN